MIILKRIIIAFLILATMLPSYSIVVSAHNLKSFDNSSQWIVKLKGNVDKGAWMGKMGLNTKGMKLLRNYIVLNLKEDDYEKLLKDPDVELVERDSSASILSVDDNSENNSSQEIVPWGAEVTNAVYAHNQGFLGQGIKIAVLDTGISTSHPDLKVSGGISFIEDVNYEDDNGHGTHVAGIINSQKNGIGVVGISPNAELYALKVLDKAGVGYYSSIIQAIDWCVENKINIITMSFGGVEDSKILHQVIKEAKDQGILFIAAAGNKGAGVETLLFPARYSEVLSVGSIGRSNERSMYSSTGQELDMVAPGEQILSTVLNGQYGMQSGTSMSAAYVTGAAAVLWSRDRSLDSEEITNVLYQSTEPLGQPNEYGHGTINLANVFRPIDNLKLEQNKQDVTMLENVDESVETNPIESSITGYFSELDVLLNSAASEGNIELTKKILDKSIELSNEYKSMLTSVSSKENKMKSNEISNKIITKQRLNREFLDVFKNKLQNAIDTYKVQLKKPVHDKQNNSVTQHVYGVTQSVYGVAQSVYGQSLMSTITAVTPEPISFGNVKNVTVAAGEYRVFSFQADESKQYRLHGWYSKYEDLWSCDLKIYRDATLTDLMASTSGRNMSYPDLLADLTTGTTYYIKLINKTTTSISISFSIENPPESQAILFNQPIDVHNAPYEYKVFTFRVLLNGTYRIRTTYFNNNENEGANDTFLTLCIDQNLKTCIDYNDDYLNSPFSYLNVQIVNNLVSPYSTTYYIKLSGSENQGVHARIILEKVPNQFVPLELDSPIDLTMDIFKAGFYLFKPRITANYRLFTGPYKGIGSNNDTEIQVYRDSEFESLLVLNDDWGEGNFSSVSIRMNAGENYYILLRAYDDFNSFNARFTIREEQPPSMPDFFRVIDRTATSVTLAWDASTDDVGVLGYQIFTTTITDDNRIEEHIIATVNASTFSYTVTGLYGDRIYNFKIRAIDTNGNISIYNDVSVSTDSQSPTAPRNLTIVSKTIGSVTLKWIESTDDVGVYSYHIYDNNEYIRQESSTICALVISPNYPHYITVRAIDRGGNLSNPSNTVYVYIDTSPPNAPTNLAVASKSTSSADLTWTASTDNVGVIGYDIYNGTTLIGSSTTNSYKVTGLLASTSYTFTVKAKDAEGNVSNPSNTVFVYIDISPPTAPTNLVITNKTTTSADLTWTASTDNVGVIGYDIYNGTMLVGSSPTNSYKVTGLLANTSHTITVKAKDAEGNVSEPSNVVKFLLISSAEYHYDSSGRVDYIKLPSGQIIDIQTDANGNQTKVIKP
ncbi:S8 family serine peptidase [Paenibacillus hamazuiensis]|uniref:S8 family serine peptidase n=1 Tax=Paenibacillus hamazuiensis TaxID=2936508 RepID=UPI00200E73A1|nr:S8 family serine peptidase [Paenibacillus hamazuiensis]